MRASRARRALPGCLALLAALAIAAPARADTVTSWNATAAAALQAGGTATPPGAGQGAASTAHLAMVHAAVYDAVNAIDGGHEPYVPAPDAKPWYRTVADPGWTALIPDPPYPEHPSGLTTFAGAAVETMQDFYGTDCLEFTGTTPGGVARTFTRFSQVVDDVVDARVWSGVHFRFADEEGAKIGRRVAHRGNHRAFE
jgi:hypothetical protein